VGHNAAIGIAAARPDGKVAVKVEVLEKRAGHSLLADTEDRIAGLCEEYHVLTALVPRAAFIRSTELLEIRGVPVDEFPHSPAGLTAASATFDKLRHAGDLIHDGDPILRQHVLAGMLKTTETGERYMISDRARALTAVAVAAHGASAPEESLFVGLPSAGAG
jgi:hypothetical protein